MNRYYLALVLILTAAAPAVNPPLAAQENAVTLRWWHGALLAGGLSALSLLDEPVQDFLQGDRSRSLDGVANVVRPFGEAKVYLGVTGGLYVAGLASGDRRLTDASGRLVTTLGIAMLTAQGSKAIVGRGRPGGTYDADDFAPFSGRNSMPSGHTTMAFALATSLAHDLKRPWATAGLYTLATAVGWSRLNDDHHWLSDVGAGAALGITAANLADGRWRLFGLRPPGLSLGSRRVGIGWDLSF